jgi:hypothetical protein
VKPIRLDSGQAPLRLARDDNIGRANPRKRDNDGPR